MTRQRYMKNLIGIAIGILIGILISPYLFGMPWSRIPTQIMAMFIGLAIFALVTWGTWTTDSDDGDDDQA